MNNKKTWMHGTEKYFDQWDLSPRKLKHKNGTQSHNAIFLTTNKEYALDAANGSKGLCSTTLLDEANILDMNQPSKSDSEKYRTQVSRKIIGHKNPQVMYRQYWDEGWKSGSIMKYASSDENEAKIMQQKAYLAINSKDTPEGITAFNELQVLTRSVIEELVISAKEIGFDAVIGHEIDSLHPTGPKKYEIMFVLNTNIITKPNWINVPNNG